MGIKSSLTQSLLFSTMSLRKWPPTSLREFSNDAFRPWDNLLKSPKIGNGNYEVSAKMNPPWRRNGVVQSHFSMKNVTKEEFAKK